LFLHKKEKKRKGEEKNWNLQWVLWFMEIVLKIQNNRFFINSKNCTTLVIHILDSSMCKGRETMEEHEK
jgi:hypothetical protein